MSVHRPPLRRLSDFDQATCARIEEHLAGRACCSNACESLKRTVSLCRQIPDSRRQGDRVWLSGGNHIEFLRGAPCGLADKP
jgi:hypothetical protein